MPTISPGETVCRLRQRLRERGEVHGAGKAIDQRNAIEQQARGKRAEHEILQTGLGRTQFVAREGGEDVERQRLQFEPEIEGHQVRGRYHHHHADDRQRHQHGIFKARDVFVPVVVERQDQRERGTCQHQDLHEAGERVGDELAVIADAAGAGGNQQGGEQEAAEREHAGDEEGVVAPQHAEDQDRHRDDGQRELRQRDGPVHQCTIPASLTAGASAAV